MKSAQQIAVLLGAVLTLAACGTSASPRSSGAASPVGGQASQSAASTASPTRGQTPSATAAAATCDNAPKPFDPAKVDLTGAWAGDDGGIYYLHQLGSVVWWNGMSGRDGRPSELGRDWNNVGRGEITALKIDVEWADVPRGGILGNGTLSLTIKDDGAGNFQIVKDGETGTGFGNTVWTYCRPG